MNVKTSNRIKLVLRVYGRIEALTWVLENTDEGIREL